MQHTASVSPSFPRGKVTGLHSEACERDLIASAQALIVAIDDANGTDLARNRHLVLRATDAIDALIRGLA